MVGILILTHGELGAKFIDTAKLIGIRSDDNLIALGIDPSESPDSIRDRVAKEVRSVDAGNGVLILTDLFGGTPTNISLTFLSDGKVEVVTGLNLPMVIKALNSREDQDLPSLAKLVSDAGKENIFLAGDFLRQRKSRKQNGSN